MCQIYKNDLRKIMKLKLLHKISRNDFYLVTSSMKDRSYGVCLYKDEFTTGLKLTDDAIYVKLKKL